MSGSVNKPYPAYKDSGVEWLGEIPMEWEVPQLGNITSVKARLGWKGLKADEYVDEGYVFLATPNIKGKNIDFENVNYITEARYKESPEIMLELGDVLVAKDGSTTGTTNVVRTLPRQATVNSSIAVLRPHEECNGVFLAYQFKSSLIQNTIQMMRDGMGVPHLFQADLRKFRISIPPLPEQEKIAKFLDFETRRIDQLITKQELLITLLKEKRQAVISHTVTKGLDPDVPMKDSGVKWMEKVPWHWGVVSLKRLAKRIETGGTPKNPGSFENGTIPWYTPGDIGESIMVYPSKKMVADSAVRSGDAKLFTTRSVLIVGIGATLGKAARSLCAFSANQQINVIEAINQCDTGWLYWMLKSQPDQMVCRSNSATLNILNQEKTGEITVTNPPLPEQKAIVEYLDDKTDRIDRAVAAAERAIELLKERRTALISAAVTGKIDVRGWVAPDEREA